MGYENGKIYVLRSNQTDDVYIGSTTQPLYKRIYQHKKDYKYWKNGKYSYVSSFELIKYDDVYIELLEECPCKNKMELCRREGELIRSMNCINKDIAGRTINEWREDNKEKIKEYYQENKDKIKMKNEKYIEANKDKIKIRTKEYRETNKDKLKKKYDCYCGGKYTHIHKSRHLKTQKHTNYIISTNNTE